jgi:hypothetical protein
MGGVLVPVVFLLAPGEIAHVLADRSPEVLVTWPLFLDQVRFVPRLARSPIGKLKKELRAQASEGRSTDGGEGARTGSSDSPRP